MTANGWLGLIFGGGVSAALAILAWILKRSERALSNSNTAITLTNANIESTGDQLRLILALREAISLEAEAIGNWEEWGGAIRRLWRGLQAELVENGVITTIRELPPPPKHLDLEILFRNLPKFGPNSATARGAEAKEDG